MTARLIRRTLSFLLPVLFFIAAAPLYAQQTGTIEGRVTDAETDEPIPSVNVALEGTQRGAVTGEDGAFVIDGLAPGRYRLVARFVGYEAQARPVRVRAGETTTVEVSLQASTTRLGEVTVTGLRQPSEAVSEAVGLGLTLEALPATVNTVDRSFLELVAPRRLQDAIGYIPGVSGTEGNGNTGELYTIRGFQFSQFATNGIRISAFRNQSEHFGNIERVEVIKGPSSLEFGLAEPGGVINFVTKKPQFTPALSLNAEVGSFSYYGGEIDATGPIGAADSLAYRVIVSGEDAGSFRDTFDSRHLQIAPSLRWNYGGGSSLLLEFEYNYSDQPYDRGTAYVNGDFLPRDFSTHEPTDELYSSALRFFADWSQRLGSAFTARVRAYRFEEDYVSRGLRNRGLFGFTDPHTGELPPGEDTIIEGTFAEFEDDDRYTISIRPELSATYDIGKVSSKTLAGFGYQYNEIFIVGEDGYDVWPLNIFDPVYGREPTYLPFPDPSTGAVVPDGARDFEFTWEIEEYSVYAQHLVEIGRAKVIGGLRYDTYEEVSAYVDNKRVDDLPPLEGFDDQNLSWRLGGSYALTPTVTAFAGSGVSFVPQSGTDREGDRFDALRATSYEGGLKLNLLDERFFATLTGFRIKQENITEADPTNQPGENFRLPLGSNRVYGFELDARGNVTDALELTTGVGYLSSEIQNDADGFEGNEFYNTPTWQASAYALYDATGILLPGLRLGLGAIYEGERPISNANAVYLPSYTRIDASASYRYRGASLTLALTNLFDETYYIGSQNRTWNITPGKPRTASLRVGYQF